ncbi:MAG: DUF4832 domain-containing protein [Candidatus Glassbacteria bacterium]|nr:DUF4832 domain-containing protein [Candidatus Glassbacteria bacterium]
MPGKFSRKFTARLFFWVILLFLLLGALRAFPGKTGPAGALYREDINGDGRVNITDVIALILLGRDNPENPAVDYDGNGSYTMGDAIGLLLNIMQHNLTSLSVVVEPVETDEFLLNPGVGFTSPNCTDSDLRIWNPRYPLCATAYYRWYWNEIEPEEGEIAFGMIDSVLAQVHKERQVFAFRVMCQDGSVHVPQWLIDKGLKGRYYSADKTGGFQPDYSDPLFLEYHGRLIRALAGRYDGHPDVHHVDIGTIGSWGEWNTAGAPEGFAMPPDSILQWTVDLYLESFTRTKLVMQVDQSVYMAYAVDNGTGWRADCLGDWGMWGPNWNHMEDYYPQAIEAAEAYDAWMHAPVAFEACGTGTTWYTEGMGGTLSKEETRDKTIEQSLLWHVSVMNFLYGPNMSALPDEWIQTYNEWGKKMGYRFVLRRLAHPAAVNAGGEMAVGMDWENVGVAPCYYAYPLAFQFRDPATGETWQAVTDADITGWMPGETSYNPVITVPENIPPGEYELGIAMLEPSTGEPRIKLAIQGLAGDGWYRLSRVTVR